MHEATTFLHAKSRTNSDPVRACSEILKIDSHLDQSYREKRKTLLKMIQETPNSQLL